MFDGRQAICHSLMGMPSSIDSAAELEVRADIGRCWEFFTNLENIGACIPGCESVTRLDDRTVIFRVKMSVGYISKTFELKTRFKDIVPESKVSFVGEGTDAEAAGTLSLQAGSSPGVTTLAYTLQIRPLSALGRTAVMMLGKEIVEKQAGEFAHCVKGKLEAA